MHTFFLMTALLLLSPADSTAAQPPASISLQSAELTAAQAALKQARLLFYAGVEDKSKIEPALAAFQELLRMRPEWEARTLTYIGALTALKGKHSLLPHDKWRKANQGLRIMDQAVAQNPQDVEALFIHSSTCVFLPFFFKRGHDAQSKFRRLVQLLPEKHQEFDPEMLKNVIQFISERAKLSQEETATLNRLKSELNLE
ncbi:MAG TPA: hypothetical protein PK843_08040 [bacterium]|nr:hypothetical protein [bacterium]HPN34448.1 hypothetical protein [bacterium]